MAYSLKDLNEESRFITRIRFSEGKLTDLPILLLTLQDCRNSSGLPIEFRYDTLKTGGPLSKKSEDVLILYHTVHTNDYFQFLFRLTYQGNYAFLDVFMVGSSKNLRSYNKASGGSTISKIKNSLTGHAGKMQEEEDFYSILKDSLESELMK